MKSIPTAEPQDAELDRREAHLAERLKLLEAAALCRHCGQPVELGVDGAICHAPLEERERPHPYAVHLVCQERALEQLAADSHEDIARWKLTAAGVAVLAQAQRSNEGSR